jgi:hypothetical protein
MELSKFEKHPVGCGAEEINMCGAEEINMCGAEETSILWGPEDTRILCGANKSMEIKKKKHPVWS